MSILNIEVRQEESARSDFKNRVRVLKDSYGIKSTQTTADLVDMLHWRAQQKGTLRHDYELLCRQLNRERLAETNRTPAEDRFLQRFESEWKIKLYPQTWIGNLCVDYFTPAFGTFRADFARGYILKGLALEIDGSIHETEMKMKKDQHKETSLNDLGVLVWRLSNDQIFSGRGLPPRRELTRQFGRLCSRERLRIWNRIYLMTILYHGPFGMVRSYFPRMKTVSKQGYVA